MMVWLRVLVLFFGTFGALYCSAQWASWYVFKAYRRRNLRPPAWVAFAVMAVVSLPITICTNYLLKWLLQLP